METDIAIAEGAESDIDGIERVLVLVGLGYVAFVCLAVYLDFKIQMRRARKRREARDDASSAQDRARSGKGEDEPTSD